MKIPPEDRAELQQHLLAALDLIKSYRASRGEGAYVGSDQPLVVGPGRALRLPHGCWRGRPVLSKVLGAVGVVLLIVGVVLAVRPVHAGGDSCGSVFPPDKGI